MIRPSRLQEPVNSDGRRKLAYGLKCSARDGKDRESNLVRRLNMALLSHFLLSRTMRGQAQVPETTALDSHVGAEDFTQHRGGERFHPAPWWAAPAQRRRGARPDRRAGGNQNPLVLPHVPRGPAPSGAG